MNRLNRNNVMIVFALDVEAQNQFDDLRPVYTGVGKVNAAYRLTRALIDWRAARGAPPALVLNLGSAGSSYFPTGSLVNPTGFVQRDADATALGAPPFTTLFDDTPALLRYGARLPAHPEAVCGSGDSFDTSGAVHGPWNLVDMEAYPLAKICRMEDQPFACLKYITDGADEKAAQSWPDCLAQAATALRCACDSLLTGDAA